MSVIKRQLPPLLLFLLPLALLSSTTHALAQPMNFASPEYSTQAPTPPSQSYGWQIGLVDTAALVLVSAAAGSDNERAGMLGIGGYVLGGPIVHATHGNPGRAVGSLMLRIGLPLVIGRLATGFNDCDPQVEDHCGEDDMPLQVLGGLVGVLAASTIDWFVLGSVKAKEKPAGLTLGGVTVQPTLYPTESGAQLGMVGQF